MPFASTTQIDFMLEHAGSPVGYSLGSTSGIFEFVNVVENDGDFQVQTRSPSVVLRRGITGITRGSVLRIDDEWYQVRSIAREEDPFLVRCLLAPTDTPQFTGPAAFALPALSLAGAARLTFRGSAAFGLPALSLAGTGDVGIPASMAGAYSLRRLSSSYAGSAVRVRRSSDNAEQDIGFSGAALDESALTAFVGAGNGDIVTFYDQSGNARHLTTAAGTFRLVTAGSINRGANNRPRAIGTAARANGASAVSANLPISVATVAKRTAGTASGLFGASGGSPSNNIWYGYETLDRYAAYRGNGTTSASLVQTGSSADTSAVRTYAMLFTRTAAVQAIDGGFSATVARAQYDVAAFTPSIGTEYRTFAGDWYETVFYTRTLSQSEWDALHANHATAYTTTPTLWSSLTTRPTLVLMGQSNCAGRAAMADLPAEYQGAQAGVNIWTGAAFATLNSTLNNNQFGATATNQFGWEMAVGKEYVDAYGGSINLVKYAVGSTPLARNGVNQSWDPAWYTTSGNALYSLAGMETWEAVIAMQAAGLRPDFLAFQWFQGEQDATTQAWADAYQTNLTAFLDAIRSTLGASSLPVHLMRIANEGTETYNPTVRAAQSAVAGAVSGVTLIDTDSYGMADTVHLNASGQIALGTTLAALL